MSYLKIKSQEIKEILNNVSINMKISFILALNYLILLIFLVKYLESQDSLIFNMSINSISVFLYFIVLLTELLFLYFFQDFYFIFIMLLYKFGVIIHNISIDSTKTKYSIIYFILSLLFFITFFIHKSLKKKESKKKENENLIILEKDYKNKLFTSSDEI